jgi:hypothetical protein
MARADDGGEFDLKEVGLGGGRGCFRALFSPKLSGLE